MNAISVLATCPRTKRFVTASGQSAPYTVWLRDKGHGLGVEFVRASGGSKPMSAERFLQFWEMWLQGINDLGDFRNQGEKGSRASAASYAVPVFEWIASEILRKSTPL